MVSDARRVLIVIFLALAVIIWAAVVVALAVS